MGHPRPKVETRRGKRTPPPNPTNNKINNKRTTSTSNGEDSINKRGRVGHPNRKWTQQRANTERQRGDHAPTPKPKQDNDKHKQHGGEEEAEEGWVTSTLKMETRKIKRRPRPKT